MVSLPPVLVPTAAQKRVVLAVSVELTGAHGTAPAERLCEADAEALGALLSLADARATGVVVLLQVRLVLGTAVGVVVGVSRPLADRVGLSDTLRDSLDVARLLAETD